MKNIDNRKYIIPLIFVMISLIFIMRLLYMQVIDDKWKERAAQISENKVITYPARGIVYDRNGEKLISNEVYYDLRVIPNQMDEDIDSFALAKLLDISIEKYTEEMNKARSYSKRKSSYFVKQIPPDEFAEIAPNLYKYPGFFEVEAPLRVYPKNSGGHILGYMNEVSPADIEANPYYKSGDMIGRSGIERTYEEVLRGKRGVKYYLQNAIGMETGVYEGGKYDTLAVQGKSITLGVDWELQAYTEKLFQNKTGSAVAIDPSTGEILMMVTAPSYDPNLLVGRRLGSNYNKLQKDSLLPLLNRTTISAYPPGSIFKPLMALIAMDLGVVDSNASFACLQAKTRMGCHNHPNAQNISDGVKMSCNPYFVQLTRKIIQQGKNKSHFADAAYGQDIWAEYVKSFGIGTDLHTDFPGIIKGNVPNTEYYNNMYHEYGWAFSTVQSISIGQGEVLMTPLEMANFAAILANRGYFYYPHFIREIEGAEIPAIYKKKNYCKVDEKYFSPVIDGMWRVVHEPGGTARKARVDSLNICGKTGTAENFKSFHGKRYQMTDHSVFMAFAPRDNPKIAIVVYVENSGFGGTWAAPLASLVMEKFINGEISEESKEKEQRILDAYLIADDDDILRD